MIGRFARFQNINELSQWMESVHYEAGERGIAVLFKVQKSGAFWYAKVV